MKIIAMTKGSLFAFITLCFLFALSACSTSNEEGAENTLEMCTNQIDDDANGKVDCDEESCISAGFCGEDPELNCQDDQDNDLDDYIDCDDSSCMNTQVCAHAAGNFMPEPANGGIQPQMVNRNRLRELYDDWISTYYEEDTQDPTLARIKRDLGEFTVSEGIGYGMLLTYTMDSTPARFEKLWNYYKKFRNNNGVMNWCIVEFDSVATPCDHGGSPGFNGATDAELDVVTALLQASKKWDNNAFLQDAEELALAIKSSEVDGQNLLKPGDAWNSIKNPSYFAPAAIALMDQAFPEQDWGTVLSANYALHGLCANDNTGLAPDWCTSSGGLSPNWSSDFGFEAIRSPWRLALHSLWFNSSEADGFNIRTANWIINKTGGDPDKIEGGYSIDGTTKPLGLGKMALPGLCISGTADPAFQSWLDLCYQKAESSNVGGYYQGAVNLLMLLTMSGLMQNYW